VASPSAATTKMINFNFYQPLKKRIEQLENLAQFSPKTGHYHMDQVPYGRKALLLNNALANYKTLVKPPTSAMTARTLNNPGYFAISSTKTPAYFRMAFKNSPTSILVQPGLYDYNTATDQDFWVDFANKTLGGGVFRNGFVQEETLFLETPELANVAAVNAAAQNPPVITRTGKDPGVLQGSPTPWIFLGVNRVMDLDQKVVGHDMWKTITVNQLNAADVPLTKMPEKINILAMAAPLLPQFGPKATVPILEDLFNTFVAGFSLARAAGNGQPIHIHTGPIGAGVFYNDRAVVYVMQVLAAMEVGKVNLTFHGYTNQETLDYDQKYLDPILQKFNNQGNKTVDNLLQIAHQQMRNIIVLK
jgi:hypothetical protein